MAPSQLSQLKSALSTAGLSRQSNGKKSGGNKSSSKAGLTNKDREKKQRKLDDIKQSLNKFDVKGTSGTPSQSRQKGLEMVSLA
jgi:nucleolar protein 14